MTKTKDPNAHVAEVAARLAELREERADVARGLEQIDTQLGAMTAAGEQSDSEALDELRRERAVDGQRLHELDAAIPTLERQLAEAENEAARAEQKAHMRRAWELEQKIQAAARDFQDAQASIESTYVQLEQLLQAQQAELAAAGGGHGTAVSLLNRLRTVLPSTLWSVAPRFCAAARLPRVSAAHRRTIADFLTRSRPAKAEDAA